MKTRSANRRRGERGAVAVELALVLPLLMVLVFGVIDFGRLFNAQVTLTQAAREGSRVAAVCANASPPNCGTVTSRTMAAAPNLDGMTVDVEQLCPAGLDAVVTVEWTMTFSNVLGLIPGFPTTSKTLTGVGHMPCQ
jgi:Flp pilus assembly protein TadG